VKQSQLLEKEKRMIKGFSLIDNLAAEIASSERMLRERCFSIEKLWKSNSR
jgi:hypothetical protein